MSSPYIKVSPEQLQQTAAQFQQHVSELEGTLSTMQNQMSSLENDWSGMAQQAFVSLMSEWTRDYNDMLNVLGRVNQLLRSAAESFSQGDQQFANSLNQIMG